MESPAAGEREQRISLFQSIYAGFPLSCTIQESDLPRLDAVTGPLTIGAMIALCKAAGVRAVERRSSEITVEHFLAAGMALQGMDEFEPASTGPQPSRPKRHPADADRVTLPRRITRFLMPKWPLPVCPEPFPDESFQGFLLRLADANCFTSIPKLLAAYDTEHGSRYLSTRTMSGATDLLISLAIVSKGTELPPSLLTRISALSVGRFNALFMGQVVDTRELTDSPRWCPQCLGEQPYFRNIWKWMPLDICLRHRVPLATRCPICDDEALMIPPLGYCQCGYDLKQIRGRPVATSEILDGHRLLTDFESRPKASKKIGSAIEQQIIDAGLLNKSGGSGFS